MIEAAAIGMIAYPFRRCTACHRILAPCSRRQVVPKKQYEVLVLRDFVGLTFEEIGEELAIPVPTAREALPARLRRDPRANGGRRRSAARADAAGLDRSDQGRDGPSSTWTRSAERSGGAERADILPPAPRSPTSTISLRRQVDDGRATARRKQGKQPPDHLVRHPRGLEVSRRRRPTHLRGELLDHRHPAELPLPCLPAHPP